jgi:transglutaminase-like putative cysteine protease
MKALFILLLMFLVAGCSGSKFDDISQTLQEHNVNEIGGFDFYAEADAVVLFSITDVDVEVSGSSVTTTEIYHEAKKIFKNIEDYASVEINIYDEEKLESIQARTIKPDGTEVSLEAKDFYTISGEGEDGIFYRDIKKVRFTFPSIERGAILEYSFEKYKAKPFVTDIWRIQHYVPVLKNKYTIRIPRILMTNFSWDWKYKVYNYFIESPQVIEAPKLESASKSRFDYKNFYTWEVSDVPPFEPDPRMPAHWSHRAHVRFAPSDWKTWDDISVWYYQELFKPRLVISDGIRELADQLTAGAKTTEEKIENIYDHVKNIRYIAISLGIGGIQPSDPQTVLDRKYGDCKDKSMLLISLLNAANIKADPVLLLTSSDGVTDPSFPSWSFNHMIVKTEDENNKAYWMDPTSKYSPLNHLPYQCEGINVLVIENDGKSKIEKTPSSKGEDNLVDIKIESQISDRGKSDFNISLTAYGENNLYYRYIFEDKTEKEMNEFFKSLLLEEFTNVNITDYKLTDPDGKKDAILMEFNFSVDQAIRSQGDLYMLNVDPFKFTESASWMIKEKRTYPLNFRFPYKLVKTVNVSLPERYSVRNLPTTAKMNNSYFEFSRGFNNAEGNKISLEEKYFIKTAVIPAKSFLELKKNFETVNSKYQEKIILTLRQ